MNRVDLKHGEEYAVRRSNRADYEAAAEVLIDGLSRCALSDNPQFSNGRDILRTGALRTIPSDYRDGGHAGGFRIGK